jgi:glycosyltransferase involved in cell wall biosynthesis
VYAAALRLQQPELFEQTDRFIAVSQAALGRLVELGLPSERAVALPNFVPLTGFAERSRADEGRYALVAGRLVEEKGYDTAIAAANLARVPLVIAGDGPDESRLRALAEGGQVTFKGWMDPPALADLRRGAAVVLVPSRWEEACPYAALEALAGGVPVLASDRGGLPEIVGSEGVLPADSPYAWAEALSSLWRDPAARRERGQAALYRTRELFAEDRYYESLLHVYADPDDTWVRSFSGRSDT